MTAFTRPKMTATTRMIPIRCSVVSPPTKSIPGTTSVTTHNANPVSAVRMTNGPMPMILSWPQLSARCLHHLSEIELPAFDDPETGTRSGLIGGRRVQSGPGIDPVAGLVIRLGRVAIGYQPQGRAGAEPAGPAPDRKMAVPQHVPVGGELASAWVHELVVHP